MSSPAKLPRRAIVTISTNDRVFWSRALFAAVRSVYGSDRTCIMYLIGDLPPEVSADALGFDVVRVEDMGVDAFWDMAFRYTPFELSAALKPKIVEHSLGPLNFEEVTYLDSDLIVTSRLEEVDTAMAEGARLVTVGHTIAPHEGDFASTDLRVLTAGRLNTGMMVFRRDPSVAGFLSWWGRVLEAGSRVNPSAGYFVDQMWFQHAPGFVDRCVEIRHAGYNVGHWNLTQRPIQFAGGEYRVGNEPLRFFHRSGADLDNADQVSRHEPRLRVRDYPALGRLLGEHDRSLETSRRLGPVDLRGLHYSYGLLDDGTAIPLAWRRAFARMHPHSQKSDRRTLFTAGESPCNTRAQGIPVHGGAEITELMHSLLQVDPYLQARFDIRTRLGQLALCRWLADEDDVSRLRVLESEAIWHSGRLQDLLRAVLLELLRRGRSWLRSG